MAQRLGDGGRRELFLGCDRRSPRSSARESHLGDSFADLLKRHVCLPRMQSDIYTSQLDLLRKTCESSLSTVHHHGACTKSSGVQHISTLD